ncbi:hypothetical protein BDW74DRAFT_177819 [Aspergillus multicolor]|uniref:uncharacterized protein n=1 Tax=Aspergillus multicolor TaxID=41759 RepID=UPI003CCDFCF9
MTASSTTPSPSSAADNAISATTFVFGGHIGTQSKKSLEKPVRQFLSGCNAKWILEAVAGLPQYWAALVEQIPELAGTVAGDELLRDLDSWLRSGSPEGEGTLLAPEAELPNILIGPLMVAIQLDQYWRYLEYRVRSRNDTAAVEDPQAELVKQQGRVQVETLGFCAGLLAAVAVASSHDRAEFERYSAVAVRMGMLMAALVDAREAWDKARGKGGSVSFGMAWRSGSRQEDDMASIVSSLAPDAYVSVVFDEARATVTTSERVAPMLVRKLRAAGVKAVPLGFKGHMHTPGLERKQHTEALIKLCAAKQYSDQLQFPASASQLALPTYGNSADGSPLSPGETDLTGMVLRAILMEQFQWAGIVSSLLSRQKQRGVSLLAFGLDRCIPPAITRRFGTKQVHFEELEDDIESWKPQEAVSMASSNSTESAAAAGTEGGSAKLGAPVTGGSTESAAPVTGESTESSALVTEETKALAVAGGEDAEEAIAIVGMSIKVAGADDVEEFAAMLKTGKSQHELITRDRMMHDMLFRKAADAEPNQNRKYYGNFLRDTDAFDHRFFKRSPRESQAMDPQCRLSLQAAYQAVEQSGYFAEPQTGDKKEHIGCYVGVCGVDYEQNLACYEPSAFTATGGLRSFISGRIAHFFGWTGPAMTFDTACSSSTVALHTACRNLLAGEATAALVGGANVMTSMQWMQNLSAGSFLSPTGQCKPFDADADGYCRAEGIAFVFLKKLSDAKAAGNTVLGTIRATAVYQNLNITPLFVPNVPSLSQLFKDVIHKAGIDPAEVSLVEAHGTGTPVGDPAEYESVKLAVSSPKRTGTAVPIGSVKGHVGHTEGASGIIALVKVLTMMRGNFIPPQASFKRMNPHIHASPEDMLEVPTALRAWPGDRKIALVNNYGACGSNASMIVAYSAHTPAGGDRRMAAAATAAHRGRQPFWIPGFDARSIAAYSMALARYLRTSDEGRQATLADAAFNMARQSNRDLPHGLVFSCQSLEDLQEKLAQAAAATKETASAAGITAVKAERPVVMCFGGQVSTWVGLDRALYEGVAVLRHHLDACNAAIMAAGLSSIFPALFSREPIQDVVLLQTALFALQYASARAWMDCGLASKIVSVVGHSFGEITALCVAGVLSLDDTVQLIAGRARLVRDSWGPDPGAMMAVEADEALVQDLLEEVNRATGAISVSIACYNGPRSFTLAGTTRGIDVVGTTLASHNRFAGAGVKSKRLSVTNAFHSVLVEQLVGRLGQIGRKLTFHEAVIPIERATEHEQGSADKLDWTFVPTHMRQPVFFNHAAQRLAKKHPQAVFIEAGSNSTITLMASRALSQASAASSLDALAFQGLSICNTDKGLDALTDATVALWKQGLRVSFWSHHPSQAQEYRQLLLPPYQFEKTRHWLDIKSPTEIVSQAAQAMIAAGGYAVPTAAVPQVSTSVVQDPRTLPSWTFVGYQQSTDSKRLARFRINTASDAYRRLFASHVIAQTAPICPATLELDMAIEALFSLNPEWRQASWSPTIHDLVSHAPVCANATREFYMDLLPLDKAETRWHFSLQSMTSNNSSSETHAEAVLHMRAPTDPSFVQEFHRYKRMSSHAQCKALLEARPDDDGVEALQGRNVYRAFSEIVDFGAVYRGVKYVVGRRGESAGVVHKQHEGLTWLDVPMSDSFGQVAGLYVNLLTDELPPTDMFIATGCELVMRSPKVRPEISGKHNGPGVWNVLARHERQSDKAYTTDVFVYDATTGELTDIMLGLQYARVAKASMSKMLARLTTDHAFLRKPASVAASIPTAPAVVAAATAATVTATATATALESVGATVRVETSVRVKKPKTNPRNITEDVYNLVATVAGIEPGEMTLDSEMADLGIDSLMGMELAREVESTLKCTLDQAEMMEATSLRQFVACVAKAMGLRGDDTAGDGVEQETDETDSDASVVELELEGTASGITTPEVEKDDKEQEAATGASLASPTTDLTLSSADILDCFGQVKLTTDDKIREFGLDGIARFSLAGSSRLCTALIVEAFDELGSPGLRTAGAGQPLDRITFLPQHSRMVDYIYGFLEQEARLIDINAATGQITRTHIAVPRKTSAALLEELVAAHPESAIPNRLAYYAGKNLAGVLSGATDGIRVIFGSAEGRQLVQAMYCDYAFNRMHYQQMAEVVRRVCSRLDRSEAGGTGTLKVLEMGGGTGGTTNVMAPLLASLGIPVEYTFTDLSPSMVANARRKFSKQYPFMRFAVHDIEKPPAAELRGQHLLLASNAVHATHSLLASAQNMRLALRPADGFLMMLEMTESLPFVDIVFGLLEGWWLFDDGRTHAVVPTSHWEKVLHEAGFGHVDWTDGARPENAFQKVIIALASGAPAPRLPATVEAAKVNVIDRGDVVARETAAEKLVATYTAGWATPALESATPAPAHSTAPAVVIVTGATGSLGAHLVQTLAERPDVATVVCINRQSGVPADERQAESFTSKGIHLSQAAQGKLRVHETDISKPQLGLAADDYTWLVEHASHIVHNAWPMSGTRPLKAFEPQLRAMRNLLDLAREMAVAQSKTRRIGFQFVSSIGVVGFADTSAGPRIPETRVPMGTVMPSGYTEAKWAHERMLNETLHRFPQLFEAAITRPGQIAGSSRSGFWNPVEHFAFLVKSAQALRAWPALRGTLQWLPVDCTAAVMVDLLLRDQSEDDKTHPVYHIDNPVGQPWEEMSPVLAAALDIPPQSIIPFAEWILRVRRSPLSADENPAVRVVDFLEGHFERMSCGGIILDTQRAKAHSAAMAAAGPVSGDTARAFVASWKARGFLK